MLTVRDIASKVLADDDVPCRAVSSVELLLDLCSDVLLDVVLLERGRGDIDRLLLHLIAHVDVLDDRLRTGRVRGGIGRRGGCVHFLRHGECGGCELGLVRRRRREQGVRGRLGAGQWCKTV